MFRKTWFWIVFVIIFAGTVIFNITNFDKLGDMIDLDLEMNRHDAIAKAEKLTAENGWGPEGGELAAIFDHDWSVKTYIELEHGGSEAFKSLLKSDLYSPYTWAVRKYHEKETNEATVYFTPKGEFYGFDELLPEDQPGAALPADSVIPIVRAGIRKWKIDIRHYDYIENSKVERPSGRIDHTFTYERDDWRAGDARIRIDFTVSGDELTGIEHYVYIPEGFHDRYSQMRTNNQIISGVGTFAAGLLYFLIGCIGAILFYLRKRMIEWKKPVIIGLIVAFIAVFLGTLNRLPLMWYFYDTAISGGSFLFEQISGAFMQFVLMWAIFAVSFMAAETLTKAAFPNQLRFWQIWSKDIAATKRVGGYTVAGLLLVSFFISYQIILSLITKNFDAWWSPSSSMIDPNILATYFPWYSPIATALQAGFWEECLFRAVPLGGAVVLGRKYGKEKLFLTIAIILQAFIFGASHANYPQQPSYARVIELIIPSIAFALLYVNFGLLPAIVMHYAYDAVLMSTPVFTSSAKGMIISKVIASLLILTPLWVFVIRRLSFGKWYEPSEKDLNKSWQPAEKEESLTEISEEKAAPIQKYKKAFMYIVPAAGILAIVVWGLTTRFIPDAPPLEISRAEAIEKAQSTLRKNNINLGDEWRVMTIIPSVNNMNDRFIWQQTDRWDYRKTIIDHDLAPSWRIKRARFSGDVEDRKERYYVDIGHKGEQVQIEHRIPEHWDGAVLNEKEARIIALRHILDTYDLQPFELRFVSAEPEKLPNRRDWTFDFENKTRYDLEKGEARISVTVSGDEVTASNKYIHIPEEWERAERDRQSRLQKLGMISTVIIGIFFGIAFVMAIVSWTKKRFDMKMFIITAVFVFIISCLSFLMRLPSITYNFVTAQPFNAQLLLSLVITVIGFVLVGVAAGISVGFLQRWKNGPFAISRKAGILQGFSAGAIFAGFVALMNYVFPQAMPLWPELSHANTTLPIIGGLFITLRTFIAVSILMLFVVRLIDHITGGWSKSKIWGVLILTAFGIGIMGTSGMETIAQWLIMGVAAGILFLLLYLAIFRYRSSTAILATAIFMIFSKLANIIRGGYPELMTDSIITIIAIFAIAAFWCGSLEKAEKQTELT